jgi:4'-phosphopantetheinyl transferase
LIIFLKLNLIKIYIDFEISITFAIMDFIIDKMVFNDTLIYTLSFSDFEPLNYLDHLTVNETERFSLFNHERRRKEFVATRILRHSIFGFKHIHYNEVGAPFIEGDGFISISHAKNLVGIALNPSYQIGFDIEFIQDKAFRLQSKFLNESEISSFDNANHRIMTACWSAKETLYKLAGRKKIDFKEDLHLNNVEENIWVGKIINPTTIFSLNLQIITYNNHIITFNSSPIEIEQRAHL